MPSIGIVAAIAIGLAGCASAAAAPLLSPAAFVTRGDESLETVIRVASKAGSARVRIIAKELPVAPSTDAEAYSYLVGFGAAALPLGFVAPPMFAGALVVGGAMELLGGSALYGMDSSQTATLRTALKEADLPRAIAMAIEHRQGRAPTGEPTVEATIALRGIGIVKTYVVNEYCFTLGAELTVSRSHGDEERTDLTIAPGVDRAAGLPPPQCATRERFTEHSGRLVHDTALDYAEVIAEMVSARLQVEP